MSDDLKPCPFCGSEPREFRQMDESHYSHADVEFLQIRCDECDASSVCSEDHDAVFTAWNTRQPVVAQSATTPTPAQIGAAARVLNARCAIEAGVNVDDCWKLYGDDFRDDAQAALGAAFKIGTP